VISDPEVWSWFDGDSYMGFEERLIAVMLTHWFPDRLDNLAYSPKAESCHAYIMSATRAINSNYQHLESQ
jgi:hypothetical protein